MKPSPVAPRPSSRRSSTRTGRSVSRTIADTAAGSGDRPPPSGSVSTSSRSASPIVAASASRGCSTTTSSIGSGARVRSSAGRADSGSGDTMAIVALDDPVVTARALVLHDLEFTGVADADTVSVLEDALAQRGWWLEQWPEGRDFVVGLVAQDVQDALLETSGRWPVCTVCEDSTHALYVDPDLGGPDPNWVCEAAGVVVAPVGRLGAT